jgi:hypothetical protein
MTPSIQFASGLYKAIRNGVKYSDLIIPNAPYLALCGDITTSDSQRGLNFLSWCNHNFEKVIWIPGWYEMGGYKGSPRLMIEQLDSLYRFVRSNDLLNIVIGNKTEINEKDVLILATPLYLLNPSPLCNPELYSASQKVVQPNVYTDLKIRIEPVSFQELEKIYRSEYDWVLKKAYYHKLHGNNTPIVVVSGSMTHLLGCDPEPHAPGFYKIIKDSPICLNIHGADFSSCDGGNTTGYAEDNVWYGVNDYRYMNYDPHKTVGMAKREMR